MRATWNSAWSNADRTLGLYGKVLDAVEPGLDVLGIMANDLKTVQLEEIEDRISLRTSAKVKATAPKSNPTEAQLVRVEKAQAALAKAMEAAGQS